MINARQSTAQSGWGQFAGALCLGVIVIVLPAVVHILNLVKIHGFPLGFFTTAHVVPVLCVAFCWVAVSRQGGPPMPYQMSSMPRSSFFSGLSLAIASLGVPLTIVSIDAAFNRGYDGLVLGLGWSAGMVLVTTWTGPLLARRNLRSVPALLGQQTNNLNVERVGIFVAIVVSGVVLVAVLALLADNVARVVNFARVDVLFGTAVIASVMALALSQVGLRRLLLGCAIVVLFAILALLVWIGLSQLSGSVPQLGYGSALKAVAELERQALISGVADPVTFKVHARPEVHFDLVNFAALTLCLMLATAVMPHILCAVENEKLPSKTGSAFLIGAIAALFVLLLVLTAPAIAAVAKFFMFQEIIGQPVSQLPSWLAGPPGQVSVGEICGRAVNDITAVIAACAAQTDHGGVVRVDDVALTSIQPVLLILAATHAPTWIWVVCALGVICAFVSFILALTAALKTSFFENQAISKPGDEQSPNTANAKISVFVFVNVAAVLAMTVGGAATELFVGSFSIAAGAFIPALLITMLWPNTNPLVVIIGMVVGLLVGLFYLLAPLFAPIMFFHLTMPLSTVADYAKEDYFELLTLWRSAGPDEKLAAWGVLTEHTRPLANWFGLRPAAAGIFGITFGCIAMIFALPFYTERVQTRDNAEL